MGIETIFPLWVIFSLSGLALVIGTYVDIKKREVPDSLTYTLIALGLFMNIISSIFLLSWIPIIASLTGLFAAYCVGALFYYGGQWGGGDAKMLMGIGALWGFNLLSLFTNSSLTLASAPLLFVFILAILFGGLIYGILVLLVKIISQFKIFRKAVYKKSHEPKTKQLRLIVIFVTIAFLVIGMLSYLTTIRLFFVSIAVLIIISYYALLWAKVAEETLLLGDMFVSKLSPGEWVAKPVFISTKKQSIVEQIKSYWALQYRGKEFHHDKTKTQFINHETKNTIRLIVFETYGGIVPLWSWLRQAYVILNKGARELFRKKIIYALHIASEKKFDAYCASKKIVTLPTVIKKKNFFFDKILLCSKQSEGISDLQIKILKQHNIKSVSVKKGIPFMPAFLIGFFLTLAFYFMYVL